MKKGNKEKTVFILRGIPGDGKSSVAELLAKISRSSIIHSTDDYHKVNGKYKFNKERLWEFHSMNLKAFEKSCEKGIKIVICDNTNIRKSYYSPYIRVAKKYKYWIFILTVGDFNVSECWKRNKHHAPRKVIQGMKNNFILY